jgi:tetratricopeptide (TPR) repeat protein
MASEPPKVLISYSHDSPEHAQRVLKLANHFRSDGIDCTIDQYVVAPPEGWPRWMDKQIRDSDFVVMVCTETYYQRVMGEEEPEKGLGVRWEGHLIYQAIYRAESMNTRFIPVLFESGKYAHIPAPVQSTTFYLAQTQDGYEDLYRRLTDQPRAIKPEIGKLRSLPPVERKSEGAVGLESVFSNLPDRNPFFTGRERVMVQLHEVLVAQGRAALSGLGGVWKTQAAVEYTHRHFDEYAYTLWATAHSHETLVSSYATLAGVLKLPEAGAQDQTAAVEAVKRWLSSNQGWLLILDNADDIVMTRAFLPSGGKGHVILTTRAQATGAIARRVEIQEMETEEGALFLLRRAMCIAGDTPLDAAGEIDRAKAKEITAQFDGLPLALDQAGAYIEETACGLSGYLELYRHRAPELLRRRGMLASDHPDPVATTWALSFENIENANPAAAELLRFCAFLHPEGIPEEVFSKGASELGPALGSIGSDSFELNSSVSEILKYSLLRREPKTRTLEIHRLVQAVLKQGMEMATQRLWAERAVRVVDLAFPDVEFWTWAFCERLLAQVHACAELIKQWGIEFSEAGRLLNAAGVYLHERGRYTDAEPLYERALAILEKALGAEHSGVARSLNNLAELYRAQGRYAKAEPLYERSLTIRETALGLEHSDVATSLNNLALLYYDQGSFAKAEPLYERALAIKEKMRGPEHPDVATSLNNLATIYLATSRSAAAVPIFERSLAIREKALGPEHPDVAISLNNLAELYRVQGQYAKAEPLFQRALAIRKKAFGPEHPDVAMSLNNLGLLYRTQGRYAKAEPLFQRALAIQEEALGPEHPDVAISLDNLAGLYDTQGQYAKAEPFFQRALAIREKALGPEHPHVQFTLDNLAQLLKSTNRLSEAEPLMRRALAILETALGREHPDVATSINNLGLLYRTQGQYAKAEPLFQRALAIWKKILGPDHPSVATSLNNLAGLYYGLGQYTKAVPLFEHALAIWEKVFGPEHLHLATCLENFALCLRNMGRSQEAEPLESRAKAIRRRQPE